jgi:hypothetical protein
MKTQRISSAKKYLIIILSVVCMLSIATIGAYANNSSDTYETLSFAAGDSSVYTSVARMKTDATSSYIKSVSASYYFTAAVWGQHAQNSQPVDVSGGNSYRIDPGQARYLVNYAYEWGYDFARIKAFSTGSTAVYSAYVAWSPDSV